MCFKSMNRLLIYLFIPALVLIVNSTILQAQSSLNAIEESYVNEDLVFSMHDDLIRFPKSSIPFRKEAEAIVNTHNSNQIDTCATYTYKSSMIELYELPRKVIPSESIIRNSELTFRNGIKVGLIRSSFNEIVSKKTKSDLVEISDLEYNTVFKFEFRNDTLSIIRFSGYVD